ncbi:MAG: hypothetical protein P5683_01265 [Limnospira sp. PMC 1279.21]|uniref:DUF2281 domain-containing protein n=3 Tax=Limnospira TaxID=2596745 RepID=B5VZ65_LIMMA|nr:MULTISPECIES: hypothetical protein [Limnospira]MDC0839093.1 hypothetical protein [Limnoraphis robusta]EDZ95537.1 hypothetical protein AmaxDRAFT_1807 [Limnospira maxima CS-328]MDT9176229.1 hypothetical protein [Limnospira sp. PMC 1238.20]MDT9186496.1 hypothetical protein [Limnospira sp. PMC 894.15]MDT9196579.1 hypothetical protein [Limnospira sp. PMC 1042.18]
MDTQKILNNPESNREANQVSIQEQFHQEIEQTPDEILAIALEFLLFMRSRASDSSRSTAASILKTLEKIGQWEGDDLEECLELVHTSRGQLYISTDDTDTQALKAD